MYVSTLPKVLAPDAETKPCVGLWRKFTFPREDELRTAGWGGTRTGRCAEGGPRVSGHPWPAWGEVSRLRSAKGGSRDTERHRVSDGRGTFILKLDPLSSAILGLHGMSSS